MTKSDREWFGEAVVGILPDLLGTARRLTRNDADAEDLVAEAVARAWVGFASLKDRDRFRGWLFRILTNQFTSQHRANAVRPNEEPLPDETSEFSLFEQLHQPFLLWWSTPEREFLNKLVREDFERGLDSLPEAFRITVIMADLGGASYAEIARQLDVPVGTVRSRLARGRSLLQRSLWEHARDAGLNVPRQDPNDEPHD